MSVLPEWFPIFVFWGCVLSVAFAILDVVLLEKCEKAVIEPMKSRLGTVAADEQQQVTVDIRSISQLFQNFKTTIIVIGVLMCSGIVWSTAELLPPLWNSSIWPFLDRFL